MLWFDETERHVRPGLSVFWGATLFLIGLACVHGFFEEVALQIQAPISMDHAHEHLDAWVSVTGVRFDCEQVFNFMSSDRKYQTSYVVASSEDGTVAALARYAGTFDCPSLPAGAIRGRFRLIGGNTHLASMRRSGLRIPETEGPTLTFDMELEPDNEWVTLGIGVVALIMGMRAFRSGLKRRSRRSRGDTLASGAG